jgi:hypothetical protein
MQREQFIEAMSQGPDPAQARKVVELALDRLGWAQKAEFQREDALAVSNQLTAMAAASLAESGDPDAQALAGALRQFDPNA